MKKALCLPAAILGILFFGRTALGGFSIYGDRTYANWRIDGTTDLAIFCTLGGEYRTGVFFTGGFYSFAAKFDPAPVSYDYKLDLSGFYSGKIVAGNDAYGLSVICGYYAYNWTIIAPPNILSFNATSLALGLKGTSRTKPVSGSLAYMFGISDSFTVSNNTEILDSQDPGFTLLDVQAYLAFSRNAGACLIYRYLSVTDSNENYGAAGFGLGIQASF
ncbi:MAG: hypothetical protein ACM3WV_09340 [Bacillota bacterium]